MNSIALKLRQRGLLERAAVVARLHHVTLDDMLGRSRLKPHVDARHALWTELYPVLGSYPAVARLFEVNHVSVLRALRKRAA